MLFRSPWYSTDGSDFGAAVGAPPDGGFAINVFLRDGERVFRTWHSGGRGAEQLTHTFGLVDLLPWGRQEHWQDSPAGWPQGEWRWPEPHEVAGWYGPRP